MRPPAEQLIRDYLNCLSVAARTRLPPEDRHAFLVRTRDFIERQSGVRGTADPAEVMRILSGIGEPEAVVARENAKLEAKRRKRAAAAHRVRLWKPRQLQPGTQPRTGDADGAESGKDSGTGSGAQPSPADNLSRKDGSPLTGEIKVTSRPITSRWRPGGPLKRGETPPAGPVPSAGPAPPAGPVPSALAAASQAAAAEAVRPDKPADSVPATAVSAAPGPARRLRRPQLPQPGDLTRDIARRAADAGRRHRLEAVCVALMAIAGLIYPVPIWLVGFAVWLLAFALATSSKVWSLPDKWVGLVGPVALVIIGTAAALSLGGTRNSMHAYLHEALADSRYLIKIGDLLGAGYLAWRLQRGRRSPAVPSWIRRQGR